MKQKNTLQWLSIVAGKAKLLVGVLVAVQAVLSVSSIAFALAALSDEFLAPITAQIKVALPRFAENMPQYPASADEPVATPFVPTQLFISLFELASSVVLPSSCCILS